MAGKDTNRKKGSGRNRRDDLTNYWKRKKPALAVEDYRWRINGYRGDAAGGGKKVRLDPIATGLSWEDKTIQTATLTLQAPDEDEPVRLTEGHRVVVHYARGENGKWHELWDMRIVDVDTDLGSGAKTFTIADELEWLKRSRDDFLYKKGDKKGPHKRPDGWTADEVAKDVCRRYGIKVGRLAKGKHKITNLSETDASPLSVIQKAYEMEREETGTKFVIRMHKGRLFVTTLRRSSSLLVYAGQILGGNFRRAIKQDLATELTVRASVKRKKGEHKKITVTVRAGKKLRKRYGYVHNSWEIEDVVPSPAGVRKRARRRLAEKSEPEREVSIQVPGHPGIRRGDAIQLKLATEGLKELLYVKTASHNVSSGSYTTDLTLSFSDPFRDKEGDEIREKICEEAKKKGHKPPDYCKGGRVDKDYDPFAPKGKTRRNRRDSHHKKRKEARR